MTKLLYLKCYEKLELANKLANFTRKILITEKIPDSVDIYLQLDKIGLAIVTPKFKPIYIEDIYSKVRGRTKFKDELLIQAINIKVDTNPIIFDLTAGFGKDAALLANYGYNVIMVERNYILATILFYALTMSFLPAQIVNLTYEDSIDFIKKYQGAAPQVIYIDPMFKHKVKSLAKKEMQLIQLLIDEDYINDNIELLFQSSLNIVKNKLIIKRDNNQVNLVAAPLPSYSKYGKTIRYDVYLA